MNNVKQTENAPFDLLLWIYNVECVKQLFDNLSQLTKHFYRQLIFIVLLNKGKQVNQFIEEEKREDQHSSLNEDSLVKMVSGYSNLLPSYNLAPNGKYRN